MNKHKITHKGPKNAPLSQSLDNYINVIYGLEKQHDAARVKDIAARLGFKQGSVVNALSRLEALGLIVYPPYRPVSLTRRGVRIAARIRQRNRVLSHFFTEVLDMEAGAAKDAALQMGFAVDETVVERMKAVLHQAGPENLAAACHVWPGTNPSLMTGMSPVSA